MKVIRFPERDSWPSLLARPTVNYESIRASTAVIIDDVKRRGDNALRAYTKRFDDVELNDFRVTVNEIDSAQRRVPEELKAAISLAASNIEEFHLANVQQFSPVETMPGVRCWSKNVAIERVGLYTPAGSAPLFSTVLMLAIPARLAGCREIVLCSPPDANGVISDSVLYAAAVCGVTSIFRVGGAQAIAAMANGTESIPRVDKIFGPGNSYVTCAKQLVSTDVAIDMPAGPSEVAVLADESCNPAFVAADLLSQAEHGPDSQVVFVTDDEAVLEEVLRELTAQVESLPRRDVAKTSLSNSIAIVVSDIQTGLDLLNEYAAEHLILAVDNPSFVAERVTNAGSVFLGNYSCESAGDYASGTNHTLPTGGFARSYSGVSIASFSKTITFQEITRDGIREVGPAIQTMAAAEGLEAHKRAISIRLEGLK